MFKQTLLTTGLALLCLAPMQTSHADAATEVSAAEDKNLDPVSAANLQNLRAPSPGDPALETLLKTLLEPATRIQLTTFVKAELDPKLPGEEVVVQWTMLGGTYWQNYLSILSHQDGNWTLLSNLTLAGVITLASVAANGAILVKSKVLGPNDPACCPTQDQQAFYQYASGKLAAVK